MAESDTAPNLREGDGPGWLPPVWRQPDGAPVSCVEKIKVLNDNLAELAAMAQDALEDAVLMGCDEAQVRGTLAALVAALDNPYRRG